MLHNFTRKRREDIVLQVHTSSNESYAPPNRLYTAPCLHHHTVICAHCSSLEHICLFERFKQFAALHALAIQTTAKRDFSSLLTFLVCLYSPFAVGFCIRNIELMRWYNTPTSTSCCQVVLRQDHQALAGNWRTRSDVRRRRGEVIRVDHSSVLPASGWRASDPRFV